MEILSTIKPSDVPKKPEIKIEYNNRSYESYIKTGFPDYIPHDITGPYDRIKKWLNLVDLRKGPIERTVRTLVRLKAPDWNTPKHERKEYLYYEEDWHGNNWLGIPVIKPGISGHIEGKYTEVITKPILDERTGEHIKNAFGGTREVYYIPFSKSTVDEIIKNSAHSDKSNIKFIVKFGREEGLDTGFAISSRNEFSYDMFLWPFDKLCSWQFWPVDDLFSRAKAFKSSTATYLESKPR